MNVGDELQHSLRSMGFVQLLLLLAFVAGYAISLGRFVGPIGRQRAALIALAATIGFCFMTTPWVHGVLLMAMAVGGMGLFIAFAAAISRLLGLSQPRVATEAVDSSFSESLTTPASLSGRDDLVVRPRARRRPQTDGA